MLRHDSKLSVCGHTELCFFCYLWMHCSLSTADIFLTTVCSYSLSEIHYCTDPSYLEGKKKKPVLFHIGVIMVQFCTVSWCFVSRCSWKHEKKILSRALLLKNGTDPGMPYDSAEIMNTKNCSEGQISIKGWRQFARGGNGFSESKWWN